MAELQHKAEHQKSSLEATLAKIRWEETERRRLHNIIQELKGNIRVFCRLALLLLFLFLLLLLNYSWCTRDVFTIV